MCEIIRKALFETRFREGHVELAGNVTELH